MDFIYVVLAIAVIYLVYKLIAAFWVYILVFICIIGGIVIAVKVSGNEGAKRVLADVSKALLLLLYPLLLYTAITVIFFLGSIHLDRDSHLLRDIFTYPETLRNLSMTIAAIPIWVAWGLFFGLGIGLGMAFYRIKRPKTAVFLLLVITSMPLLISPVVKAAMGRETRPYALSVAEEKEAAKIEVLKKILAEEKLREASNDKTSFVEERLNHRISDARASSFREKHPPSHAFDGQYQTAWNHRGGKGRGPKGEWLEAVFETPVFVKRIELSTGWNFISKKGIDLFEANSHIKRGRFFMRSSDWSDAETSSLEFAAGKSEKHLKLKVEKQIKTIRLEILDAWPGKKWNDICIASIDFFGREEI